MKYGVILFPGSNCDRDSFHAVSEVMKQDAQYIWYEESDLKGFDCLILPGGFSYGDYLRVGSIARFSPVMQSVIDFANSGGLVIGICNGFQILLEAHLLPGALLQNRDVHFICESTFIKTANSNTPFTNKINKDEVLNIPINHMDGNYFCDDATLKQLEENNQIVFQYCDREGNVSESVNLNGSLKNIAGICNEKRNVFGLMPHPERAMEDMLGSTDGTKIFESIQSHFS